MKAICLGSFAFWLAFSAPAFAAATDYRIVNRIKVTDGGFDYATFDPALGRVYTARPDLTNVIDVKTGKVTQLNSAVGGHMTLPVPGSTLAVLPQRQGTARVIDVRTDKVVADIPAGKNPDGAVYDPFSKRVFVMNHDGGDATMIDVNAHAAVAKIPIGGTLEFPASDGKGKIFVNVEDAGEIAVIDVAARKVTGRYKLAGCNSPTGLAYLPRDGLLVSSCDGVAKVVQAATGKEVASVPIGDGADAVIYDAKRRLVFIPCGESGELDVLDVADPAHIAVVQKLATQTGSRTGTIDPDTGRLYLMASKPDLSAVLPKGVRVPRLAGSFEVLVVAP